MPAEAATPAPTVSSPDPAELQRRAALVALASVAAVVLLWTVFIEFEWGQYVDDLAINSRTVESPEAIERNYDALELISNASLAAGCIVFVVIGAIRRRLLVGIVAACVVGGATVATEFLKRYVVERPVRIEESVYLAKNTFPSGHATISTALALAAVMVAPVRWRTFVAVFGALWVSFQCSGVVAAGWHRPSDALAGIFVALACASSGVLALALLRRVQPSDDEEDDGSGAHWLFLVLAAVLALLVVSVVIAGNSPWSWGGFDFVVSSALIDIVGIGSVVLMMSTLSGWSLGCGKQPGNRRIFAPRGS